MKVDYLIIGQGLAGSLLGWELIQRGCSVVVVDGGKESASMIAAGLVNPVTGMRFVKSADVETLLPAAKSCYSSLSEFFGNEFYIEMPMVRIFNSTSERSNAEKRLHNPEYKEYIDKLEIQDNTIQNIATPYGFLEQKQTGYLLTRPLLKCLKTFFISHGAFIEADMDYQEIKFEPELCWKDVCPGKIIFAEGYQATQNPWFSWLPFQPVKGEILTLKHNTALSAKIFNYGNWLIPVTPDQIRIGATFDRDNLNKQITENGKRELLESLNSLSPGLENSMLIDHCANIRPCTLDRHPFLGKHPGFEQLAIFNGFGAKGSLQIPWYTTHFADYLLTDAQLMRSCNIGRHTANYFKQ